MKTYQIEAIKLAKNSILEKFFKYDLEKYSPENKELKNSGACFITLKTINNNLRGCIGSIIAHRELYLDIIENAKSSAFGDPRFPSISENELNDLKIEITILSPLKSINFKNIEKFLDYLKENKPGIVIKLGYKQATFLPSVWEELPNEKDFLTHLILKAGMSLEIFQNNFGNIEIFEYYGDEFGGIFSQI